MTKRLLENNLQTGEKTYHHYDWQSGKTFIEVVQDVKPYLERNKRLQNGDNNKGRGKKMDFMHIATIPNNVIVRLKEEHGVDVFNKDDLPKLERLLNSREFMYLRTVDKI